MAAGVLLATFAYTYGLDSIFAPTIGDESLYLQIARVTAGSGHLLPLRWEAGVWDTKPPMLFWQGIASTAGGRLWDLWHLRLPVVALSFATAALAGWVAWRTTRRREVGFAAALVFLGFASTIQYGRTFLTNAGETLFLFLSFVLVATRARATLPLALLAGLSMGMATLYKSFVLVVPGTFALALVLWRREGWSLARLVRRHALFLGVVAATALAMFALWPVLDPQRELIWTKFVVGENAGKLNPDRFFRDLLWGEDSIWQIWLGPLRNAGLYAPLVAALAWDLWRRRRALEEIEAESLLYLLAFLLFFTVPTQRQANYVLATMPAVAVLLARRLDDLPGWAFRLPLAVLGVAGFVAPAFLLLVRPHLPGLVVPATSLVLPALVGVVALAGAASPRLGRATFPWMALTTLVVAGAVLVPFSHPFPAAAQAEARGRTVWFPDRFEQTQERYRFLLPGANIRGYACKGGMSSCDEVPGAKGDLVVFYRPLGTPLPAGYEAVAALPHFRGRHTDEQILQIIGGKMDLLVEWMVLARPVR